MSFKRVSTCLTGTGLKLVALAMGIPVQRWRHSSSMQALCAVEMLHGELWDGKTSQANRGTALAAATEPVGGRLPAELRLGLAECKLNSPAKALFQASRTSTPMSMRGGKPELASS